MDKKLDLEMHIITELPPAAPMQAELFAYLPDCGPSFDWNRVKAIPRERYIESKATNVTRVKRVR